MLVRFNNVTKEFPQKVLFSDASFSIYRKEKCGLIGLNGCGKSTLIKMILGNDPDYKGEIVKPKNMKVACLSQEMYDSIKGVTLYDALLKAFPEANEIQAKLDNLTNKLDRGDEYAHEYGKLMHRFEDLGGYDIKHNIEKVLTGLSFYPDDFKRDVSTLSGGEKRRAGLGFILLQSPDLLILDEPTNHLDILSVKWLEGFLISYTGAVLLISHDRYFLDKVVNKIIEIDNLCVSDYKGGYEDYIIQKSANEALQQKEYEKQQKLISKTEEFIRRNIEGQKTKQAKSRRKMLEKVQRLTPVHNEERKILIDSWDVSQSYNHVIHAEGLSKSFGEKKLFEGLDFNVYKGDKIAILGPNGAGKTTFFKMITGEQIPDNGELKVGGNVAPFYFAQNLDDIKGDVSVFDFIHSKTLKSTENEIRSLLAWFYFRGDVVSSKLDNLSGGEKSRLMALTMLLSGANLLLLDEPTNHLDIYTRESLAEALSDFPGSLIFISHDRYFIDSVATKIFVLNDGTFKEIMGSFSENEDEVLKMFSSADSDKKSEKENIPDKKADNQKKNVNTYKVNKLESEISELEKEIEEKEGFKFLPEYYKSGEKMKELSDVLEKLNEKLLNKIEEWESCH
jgi:ATP-binding cassette subfamily F protein 3